MFVVCRGCLKEPFFSNLSDKIDNLLVPNSFMKSRMKSQSWLLWRIGIFMLQSMRWITQTLSSLRTKPRTYVIREVSITVVMIPCWLDPVQKQTVSNTSQTWTSGFTKWCAWSSIFVFCYGLFFSVTHRYPPAPWYLFSWRINLLITFFGGSRFFGFFEGTYLFPKTHPSHSFPKRPGGSEWLLANASDLLAEPDPPMPTKGVEAF